MTWTITSLFLFSLLLFALEYNYPEYKQRDLKNDIINLSLGLINNLLIKILFPLIIFHSIEELNYSIINLKNLEYNGLITIIIFDFFIYWQHRLFHKIDFLFKFHRVHHTEKTLTFTSGVRFHFGEIILSTLYKVLLLFLLRPSLNDFILYEFLLLTAALFNHANFNLPRFIELIIGKVLITPKIHRVHHSYKGQYMNSNYGNLFVFWDKIFRSFKNQGTYHLGLTRYQRWTNLLSLLKNPFFRN